jgi:hypothetical protein
VELTSDNVEAVLEDCLFGEGEPLTHEGQVTHGIMNDWAFHPQRLESHRQDVHDMLAELPHEFRESEGGGWSFLNACMRSDGEQWTGFHQVMDHLFSLGQALGLVDTVLPRDLWPVLPGGMPYYMVKM